MSSTRDESTFLETLTDNAAIGYKLLKLVGTIVNNMRRVPRDAEGKELMPYMIQWSKEMLIAADVEVEHVGGEPPPWGVLQVSNHRSYMDIVVLGSLSPGLYVAKADIEGWPIMGKAAKLGGSVFVQRDDRDSRAAVRETVRQQLKMGNTINIFPEGTTASRPGSLPFKLGAFHVAVDEGISVVPVAIEYPEFSDGWINAEPAIQHFSRVHRYKKKARISFGPKLTADSGEELAEMTKNWIDAELARMADFDKPVPPREP